MNNPEFQPGQTVEFTYALRSVRGVVKENRGPIGVNGRVLYLVEFQPERHSSHIARIELPAVELKASSNHSSPTT